MAKVVERATRMQSEDELSFTSCYCQITPEAREISQAGKPHVHCPCAKCNGKATWRMTAWRHHKSSQCEHSSTQPKQKRRAVEEDLVEYEDEFHSEQVYSFEDSYMESADSTGVVCAGADRELDDHDDINGSPNGSSDEDGDNEAPGVVENDEEVDLLQKFVQDSVLQLVKMKQRMGCSINHFEELLEWGRNLHTSDNDDARRHWPRNWDEVQSLLEKIGFSKPKNYWICFNKNHPCQYGLMESKTELCPHCGQAGTIPYYYLGLPNKVKQWCSSIEMCKKMTAHWSQRDHWLPDGMKDGWGWPIKHEIWDGTRFANLAYFWNPNAVWVLPVRCTYVGCNSVISAVQIMNSPQSEEGLRRVKCPSCGTTFDHSPREAQGDPRNIAYCGKYSFVTRL